MASTNVQSAATLRSASVRSRSPTSSTPSPRSVVPELQATRWRSHSRRWWAACRRPVSGGAAADGPAAKRKTRPGIDVGCEAERLHSLIDGIAMHATLDPKTMTAARQMDLLTRHLDSLA